MSWPGFLRATIVLMVALALHLAALSLFSRREPSVQIEGGALQVQLGLDVAMSASTAGGQQPEPQAAREEPSSDPEPVEEISEPDALIPTEIEPELAEPEPQPEETPPVRTELPQEEPDTPEVSEAEDTMETPSEIETPAEDEGEAPQDSASAQTGNQGASRPAAQAGNAASANYAGEVMEYLSQRHRPRASSPGSTLIAFTIAMDGSLDRLEVDRSSGSRRFDREALRMIERAAPFPVPPPGVNRDFVVEIEGR